MKIGYICRIAVCLVVVIAALLNPTGKGFWFGILRHCLQLLNRDDPMEKNYFDLGNPASFAGPQKLYLYLKEEGNFDVTKNQVATWLKNKDAYSLHRQSRKPKRRSRVVVEGIDSQWDIDLMDVGSLTKKNDGIKFLLVAIDIFSKYLFVRPLKNKTGKEVKAALEDIFRKGRKPKKCRFDQGK